MKFDITKVVYFKADAELSSDVKIGTKGYFADNITDLRYRVENERKNYYYDELKSINIDSDFLFHFVNLTMGYSLFYPGEEPKEKKYRPYTWEEREYLRGKWIKRKCDGKNDEELINNMYISNDNLFVINDKTSEHLLNYYTWLDDSPFGVEIIYV